MAVADLVIGKPVLNIEARAGERPWIIRVPLTDEADAAVVLTGATLSMTFKQGGTVNAAYTLSGGSGLAVGSPNNHLLITLNQAMAIGSYSHKVTATLANGVVFILKGNTEVK